MPAAASGSADSQAGRLNDLRSTYIAAPQFGNFEPLQECMTPAIVICNNLC
jgi:hypothetical protein